MSEILQYIITSTITVLTCCGVLLVLWDVPDIIRHRMKPERKKADPVPEARHRKFSHKETSGSEDDKAKEYVRIIGLFYLPGENVSTWSRKFLNRLRYNLNNEKYDWLKAYAYDMLVSPTRAEKEFYAYLESRGIRYIPQCICTTDRPYVLDCYLPDRHAAVEIDGGYHLENGQMEKDLKRTRKIYKYYGMTTYRFTNDEILSGFFRSRFDEMYGSENHKFKKFEKIEKI